MRLDWPGYEPPAEFDMSGCERESVCEYVCVFCGFVGVAGFCVVRLGADAQAACRKMHNVGLRFFQDTPLAAKLRCKVA